MLARVPICELQPGIADFDPNRRACLIELTEHGRHVQRIME
jgi:hypothetical protein